MNNELLEKVKELIPFRDESSKVEWGGSHVKETVHPYVDHYTWSNGWQEEGLLHLNDAGEVIGVVDIIHSNPHEEWREEWVSDIRGDVKYILSYELKHDTEVEEYAALYLAR